MQPILKDFRVLLGQIEADYDRAGIGQKIEALNQLNDTLADSGIWNNPANAQSISKQAASLQKITDPWVILKAQVSDIIEFIELGDSTMLPEFRAQYGAFLNDYYILRKNLLFSGQYDDHDAIIRLTAGVGGTDAQDWTQMLERMYLRWAELNNYDAKIIERSAGEEAGVKTSVIDVSGGAYIYGKLRSEHGVHRLVRLSPFNSDNLRQTSFALVEVLPKIDAPDEVQIDEKDIRVDVYRSGGKGGQSVNTTDSAVRVTHIPTGIVVAIQNERSQLQNRETAMQILRSKLKQLQIDQQAATISDLQAGESANWGSQIRNYVMHPYTLVKDTRTKFEKADIQAVLNGEIDEFIEDFLINYKK